MGDKMLYINIYAASCFMIFLHMMSDFTCEIPLELVKNSFLSIKKIFSSLSFLLILIYSFMCDATTLQLKETSKDMQANKFCLIRKSGALTLHATCMRAYK